MSFPLSVTSAWDRVSYLTNVGRKVLLDYFGERPFIVIVSDADEIPRRDLILGWSKTYNRFNTPQILEMTLHYYSFRWILTGEIWTRAFVINDFALRKLRKSLYQIRVGDRRKSSFVAEGGWHCTYCFPNVSEIQVKIMTMAHSEFSKEPFNTSLWVQHCVDKGVDLFQRKWVKIDPYNGRIGYPDCSMCRVLPSFRALFGNMSRLIT